MIQEPVLPLYSLFIRRPYRCLWATSKESIVPYHSSDILSGNKTGESRRFGIYRRYFKSTDKGQFKRQWVAIKNRTPVGLMATNGIHPGVVGTGPMSNNLLDLGSLSNAKMAYGLDMEQHAARKEPEKTEDTSVVRTRSIALSPVCIAKVANMDQLARDMGDLSVQRSSGLNTPKASSDTDSLVKRKWSTERQHQPREQKFKFEPVVVMSFNCLARSLVDNKYVNNDRDVMSWNSRKFAILDVLQQSEADVVCLQEVDEEEYKNFFLTEFLALGYGSYFKKKKTPKLDGVCVLYNEDRFELLYHKDVEFAVHDADYDRLQVAVVLALMDMRTKVVGQEDNEVRDIYIIANTHLLFNKNRGDVKFAQLCALLSAIKEVESLCLERLENTSDNPKPAIIMCGDFNFTPQSLMYHFLSQGYVVLRNCDVKMMSGQYLMFDTTYKTEQVGHGQSGITVGDFEGNYIPDIYGTADCSEWVESLRHNNSMVNFTKMPEWMEKDPNRRRLICNYLQVLSEHDTCSRSDAGSAHENEEGTPGYRVSNESDLLFCPFKFTSAYSVYDPGQNRSNEPAFTAFHGWQRGCVDYIWYTCDEVDVESIYELPAYTDVTENGNLPNKAWPSSDHFSLVSQFKRRS